MILIPMRDGSPERAPPDDTIYSEVAPDGLRCYQPGDKLPVIPESPPDPLRAQFEAEQAVQKEADYAAYVARAGQPSYKAAAVKIAAEKLGMLDTIETAIMALVDKMGDKALYVWWNETDAISRGDANWQQIESAVPWGKVTAADLFDLAAQV